MEEENRTNFMKHVRTSCLQQFNHLYFTVGLVEELSELEEQLGLELQDQDQIRAEVGDVLWYMFGLANSLENISPVVREDVVATTPCTKDMLVACGKLCGSVKKWSRGDKPWDQFRDRVQGQVGLLLSLLTRRVEHVCTLQEAMEGNIEKIRKRREMGKVRGDGNNR